MFITVELPDAQDVKVKLEPEGKFFFSATAGADKATYEVDIDLFDKVDVNESKVSTTSRNICYLVKKAESKWWSRLLKQEGKPPVFLKADWDKWVDEDEQDEKPAPPDMDFGDFDLSKLSMLGGEGADGADQDDDEGDEDDSDTEDDVKGETVTSAEPHLVAPASSEVGTKA